MSCPTTTTTTAIPPLTHRVTPRATPPTPPTPRIPTQQTTTLTTQMVQNVSILLYSTPVVLTTLGLNYVYLVWVYFLFYIGAGYPSYYYPYIIATLLDTVPQECGGTG